MAESFGAAAERYDRARPAYPDELIARIVGNIPGPVVLDVGCGTGIAARQFQSVGCQVLGVEPDPRMADFARSQGLQVQVSTFEAWQPADRTFDAVIAAQSWHWIDPDIGPTKAAQVLRRDGLLAIFGHVFEPPAEVAEPFAAAFRRLVPDSPFRSQSARRPIELYQAGYAKIAAQLGDSGLFDKPEQWQLDWDLDYTRDQWLELLPTTGGLTQLPAELIAEILDAVGAAIDLIGGRFTMRYTTLATTARRSATVEQPDR